MLEKILNSRNLERALRAVERNKGSDGLDDMQSDELRPFVNAHRRELVNRLLEGKYEPSPVRKVEILKERGGVRMLGIPTVVDRMIQQAIYLVLIPMYEEGFAQRTLESIVQYIESELLLKVNREKTKISRPQQSQLLGFSFYKTKASTKYG